MNCSAGLRPTLSSSSIVLREEATGDAVAVQVPVAAADGGTPGSAIVVATDYPRVGEVWRHLWHRLGVAPRVTLNADRPGVVTVPLSGAGRRLLALLNVAPVAITLRPALDGQELTTAPLTLGPRRAHVLSAP